MSMRFDPVTGEKIQQDSEPRQNQAAASGAARAGRSGFRYGSGRERSGPDAGWHLSGHDAWRRSSGDRRFWAAVFLSAACA